jgi:hypothetical protein
MNIDPMGVVGHGLSTTAHAWKMLIPRQPACCPHHGGLLTCSVRSNLSRGGDEKYVLPRRFEGVVTATPWGNRHSLYRCQHLEDARTMTAAAEAVAAVEAAVTGQKQ